MKNNFWQLQATVRIYRKYIIKYNSFITRMSMITVLSMKKSETVWDAVLVKITKSLLSNKVFWNMRIAWYLFLTAKPFLFLSRPIFAITEKYKILSWLLVFNLELYPQFRHDIAFVWNDGNLHFLYGSK